jgi:hypothetical protein
MLADLLKLQRQLFVSWTRGAEATLKAGFEAHNATFSAAISCIDAINAAQKPATEQWQGVLRQQQKAVLNAWESHVRSVETVLTRAP